MNNNPYQPPNSQTYFDTSSVIKRHGDSVLFVPNNADLPPRCIKCNDNVEQSHKRTTFYYSPPLLMIYAFILALLFLLFQFILIPISIVTFAIVVYTIRQKKVTLHINLCTHHKSQHTQKQLIWLFLFIVSFIGLIYSSSHTVPEFITYIGILGIIISLVGSSMNKQPIKVTKITKEAAYLKGFGTEFLNSFSTYKNTDITDIQTTTLKPIDKRKVSKII